jgi:hypothetical protein
MRLSQLMEAPVDDHVDRLASVMLTTGVFSPHGSTLDEFIEQYEDDQWWDTSIDDTTEIIKSPEFIAGFREWLVYRYRYTIKNLRQEMQRVKRGSTFELHRTMYVNEKTWNPATGGLGIYWGTGHTEAYNAKNTTETEITITAECNRNSINWHETIVSRLDYINGDYESEIQLKQGAPVNVIDFYGIARPLGEYQV